MALYGVGIALPVESTLGLSPWDVFHQGLAKLTGWSIGVWLVIVGVAIMLLWIPLRQRPGIGTVSNALLVGVFADLAIWLIPTPQTLALRWLALLAGMTILAAATGLYIGAGLGPGPRDGIMMGLARRGWSIRVARTVIEVIVLAAGWLLGGTVGLGTLVVALCIGPLTQFFMPLFRPRVAQKM
ncbi:YczE/YyaS/YitT family protein [Rhizohabitans arisaemae]|uniref:membrane protein YczE n=1 Tax=Rhizohabitans arisaemae TaxID=2720610 RepID=UPI003D162391